MKLKKSRMLFILSLVLVLFTGLVVMILLFSNKDFKTDEEAYTYLINSDKDNVFERLLVIKQSRKEGFDDFLVMLISPENKDMLSQNAAIRFIRENRLPEFLPDLNSLYKHYGKIAQDSVWYTQIDDTRVRSNQIRNSVLLWDLDKTITMLNDLGN